MSAVYERIYAIVQTIPKGRVLTYGLISYMIAGRMSAQGVGWALKALGNAKRDRDKNAVGRLTPPDPELGLVSVLEAPPPLPRPVFDEPDFDLGNVPWQRVVNSQGGTSTHKIADIPPELQRELLEAEGVVFDAEGKIDLAKYLWFEGLPDAYKKVFEAALEKQQQAVAKVAAVPELSAADMSARAAREAISGKTKPNGPKRITKPR